MTKPILHYYYDPLCGWCYAAAPLVVAVSANDISIVLHGGGLWDPPQHYPMGMAARIREAEVRIAVTTGQKYGEAYTFGLLVDPMTVLYSRPPIAAILAAEAQAEGNGLAMLRALQKAHFVDGRRIVEHAVLTAIADEMGLDPVDFERAVRSGDVDDHIVRTRSAMSRLGVRGFPVFLLEAGSAPTFVDHQTHFGNPAAFVLEIERQIQGRGPSGHCPPPSAPHNA